MSAVSGASIFCGEWSPVKLRINPTPLHEVNTTRMVRRSSVNSFQRRDHPDGFLAVENKEEEYDNDDDDDDLSQIMCRRQAGCKSDKGSIESKQEYYDYLKRVMPGATNTVPFRDGRHRSMNDKPDISSDGGSGGGISS